MLCIMRGWQWAALTLADTETFRIDMDSHLRIRVPGPLLGRTLQAQKRMTGRLPVVWQLSLHASVYGASRRFDHG